MTIWIIVALFIGILLFFILSWHKPQYTDKMYKIIGQTIKGNPTDYSIDFKSKKYPVKLIFDKENKVVGICNDAKESLTVQEKEFYRKEDKSFDIGAMEKLVAGKVIRTAYPISKTRKECSYFLEDSKGDFFFFIEDGRYQETITQFIKKRA